MASTPARSIICRTPPTSMNSELGEVNQHVSHRPLGATQRLFQRWTVGEVRLADQSQGQRIALPAGCAAGDPRRARSRLPRQSRRTLFPPGGLDGLRFDPQPRCCGPARYLQQPPQDRRDPAQWSPDLRAEGFPSEVVIAHPSRQIKEAQWWPPAGSGPRGPMSTATRKRIHLTLLSEHHPAKTLTRG